MTAATQPHPIQADCTAEEARALTDQIKGQVERTWDLLITAHERQAWKALDYSSFQAYLDAEFGIGRSRAYQLIAHSAVIREIAAAADVHSVDLPEGATRGVKPHLAEVAEQVREAVADVPDEQVRAEVAEQVVRDAREQFLADRATGEVLSPQDWAARSDAPTAPLAGEVPDLPAAASPAGPDDDWSPSALLDLPTAPPKPPNPPKSSRPASLEDLFRDAAIDLRKAVNRLEQLTSDGRLQAYAKKLGAKHRVGLDDAVEGLGLVLTRLRDAGAKP